MRAQDKFKAKERIAKALMNMALTKSMSSNHRRAMDICDKAMPIIISIQDQNLPEETPGTSKKEHSKILFKFYLKRA